MQNDQGQNVDLYIPRKCSWTNRLLAANDFGAVQINLANIDPATGVYNKTYTTFGLSGYIRAQVRRGLCS
jgi:small subunit ribosomal protein S21e